MKITNYDEYCAASEEDRAVWLIYTLFEVKKGRDDFIGEIYYQIKGIGGVPTHALTKWIDSPDGIDALERAMIDRGYECISQAHHQQGYAISFEHRITGAYGEMNWRQKKAEAIQHAAAKALLEEGV